jgi:hypothetical protein
MDFFHQKHTNNALMFKSHDRPSEAIQRAAAAHGLTLFYVKVS